MEVSLLLYVLVLAVLTKGQPNYDSWGHHGSFEPEDQITQPLQHRPIPSEVIQKKVRFYLHTRNNINAPELMNALSMNTSNTPARYFDPTNPVRIIVHGWHAGNTVSNICKEYLKKGSYNVIMMNWRAVDKTWYSPSREMVPNLGRWLAHFIDLLVDIYNIRTTDLHIIGHSLGAHISGVAGRSSSRGQIGRITGLDPAKPEFRNTDDELLYDAAAFVDVIHTAGGFCGIYEPIGHADFYPNGGYPMQPGCFIELITHVDPACSHGRAITLFAESITSSLGFWSWPYKIGPRGAFRTNIHLVPMGDPLDPRTRGVYLLETNREPPFARPPPPNPHGDEYKQPLVRKGNFPHDYYTDLDYTYGSEYACTD